jgi:hypothetical protein
MKLLALAEYWYNTSFHSAIGMSPFEAMYGRAPISFGVALPQDTLSAGLDQWLQERQVMSHLIKQHLERAAAHMKLQVDKNRTKCQFSVGYWVFLKLQSYVQTSVAHCSSQKLAFRFFGPFQIIQRVGNVAYKLKLPDSAMIDPVFHVSQLKQAIGGKHQVVTLPDETLPDDCHGFHVPELILSKKMVGHGRRIVQKVLVKWSSLPASLATWEDAEALRRQFPAAPAWGQAVSYGGGNVSTTMHESVGIEDDVQAESPRLLVGRRAGVRVRRPSVRVSGPKWCNPIVYESTGGI